MPWPKGKPRSEETKRKISATEKGRKRTWFSPAHTGKLHSEETKRKISEKKKGNSPAWNKGKPAPWVSGNKFALGNKLSQEHKEAIRKAHLGVPIKKEVRKKISEGNKGKPKPWMLGEKNPHYSGGNSTERMRVCGTREYKEWRKAVFERDDYTCVDCGGRGVRLEADHIKPYSKFPEFRLDISNGQTRCISCHKHRTKKMFMNGEL